MRATPSMRAFTSVTARLLLAGLVMALSGCGHSWGYYSHYKVTNLLQTDPVIHQIDACGIRYYFFPSPVLFYPDALRTHEYVRATEHTFSDLGCVVSQVPTQNEANFTIQISMPLEEISEREEYVSLIIGSLSLGLIPTWGTRENLIMITVNNKEQKKGQTYHIAETRYYHLFLVPFGSKSPFRRALVPVYKEALSNFLAHSQR